MIKCNINNIPKEQKKKHSQISLENCFSIFWPYVQWESETMQYAVYGKKYKEIKRRKWWVVLCTHNLKCHFNIVHQNNATINHKAMGWRISKSVFIFSFVFLYILWVCVIWMNVMFAIHFPIWSCDHWCITRCDLIQRRPEILAYNKCLQNASNVHVYVDNFI